VNTLLRSRTACLALAAVSVGTAAWVRAVAVRDLPADFDEFEYIPAAFRYVERLAPERWSEIPSVAENPEHPPFVKILYGAELRRTGAAEPDWKSEALDIGKPIPPEARAAFAGPRSLSAVAGVLQVLLVALVSPLGSLWLAFDTYHAKFTAEALLEGVPGLFALLSVLLAERGLRLAAPVAENRGGRAVPPGGALLLLLSAVMLGLAAAGKYVFGAVVGLALLPFLLARLRRRPRWIAAYAALTLVTFVLADPALWIDPLGRLSESVFFHWRFATGAYVKKAGLPWFQPFVWLTHAAPARAFGMGAELLEQPGVGALAEALEIRVLEPRRLAPRLDPPRRASRPLGAHA